MECRECGDEVETLVKVKVGKRTVQVCPDCAERIREEQEIGEEAESAMQDMREYKGRG
jgi:ribosome-binding protein aMBF1 (putative translation factor)